jgi:uncharacterized membrane protein
MAADPGLQMGKYYCAGGPVEGTVRAMEMLTDGGGGEAVSGLPLEQRVAQLEQELVGLRAEVRALRAAPMLATPPPAPRMGAPAVTWAAPSAAAPARVGSPPVSPAFKLGESESKESLESQLGSKVLSKVAILLLLVGAAWFLKWTFDNHWIGPAGRIVTGLLAGAAVVVWSERFRKQKMAAFSYALKAVGTGVLYLSLWAGFHVYHLPYLPAGVAFAAMVCVTLWNAVMAWSQNAEALAGYALVGAYLTPVLVSTGGDHEIFLFSYLAIIAASMVALVRARPWHKLLLGALPLTVFFFLNWYSSFFSPNKAWWTAGFALLLWGLFAAAPIVAEDVDNAATMVILPVGAALFGALSIYSVLNDSGGKDWEAWSTVGFAAVYLVLARLRPAAVSAVHLGLAIVFLTVAIPLKATGHGITVGWLVEGMVLVAIASRAKLDRRVQATLRWLGWGALLLGVLGALVEPWILSDAQTAFLNREFATSLAAVVALGAAAWITTHQPSTQVRDAEGRAEGDSKMVAIALVLINVLLLAAMNREIFRAFTWSQPTADAWNAGQERADFCFSAWMMLQGAAMMALGFWKRLELARWLGLILLAATVIKVVAWDMRTLGTGFHMVSYLALGVILMTVSFAYQKNWLGLRSGSAGGNS